MTNYASDLRAAHAAMIAPRSEDAPTVMSTFSGAGGSTMGYLMAGYQEVLACEWDPKQAAAFRLNFPHVSLHAGDVAELTVERALDAIGLPPGELDLLDGSPPCQGFSTAGKRRLRDDRNGLFHQFVRLLRGIQPRAFVMENVAGLVKGDMRLIFVAILSDLRSAGYRVRAWRINAMNHGVPQSRERVIFVGAREDLGIDPTPPAPTHGRGLLPVVTMAQACELAGEGVFVDGEDAGLRVPTNRPSPTILRTSISKVWNRSFGVFTSGMNASKGMVVDPHASPSPCVMREGIAGSSHSQFKLANATPEGSADPASPEYHPAMRIPAPPMTGKAAEIAAKRPHGKYVKEADGSWGGMLRVAPWEPSKAITRSAGNLPGGAYPKFIHPTELRGLSIGEVMRLQSFPDAYAWPDGHRWVDCWAGVGNSVPPLMMRAIATHVRATILAVSQADEAAC